jgi:hypothetical protein
MIVTPVAKAPIALRNSVGFKVIAVETLLAASVSPDRERFPAQR